MLILVFPLKFPFNLQLWSISDCSVQFLDDSRHISSIQAALQRILTCKSPSKLP